MSETTTIRFPNDVNTNLLSDEEKQFVCTSALLEDTFQALDTDRNFEYAIAYVGTTLGSFRSYPSSRQLENGQCKDYDPRYRPWYVIATSGAKNIILIIDISGSMSGNRITIAKSAAKSVINTLSNSDFIGVLAFNDEVTTLNSNRVVRATDEVKTKLAEAIDELTVDGKTNYEAAFQQGFNMLDAAADDEFGAPCPEAENLFLFLTDGDPTVG